MHRSHRQSLATCIPPTDRSDLLSEEESSHPGQTATTSSSTQIHKHTTQRHSTANQQQSATLTLFLTDASQSQAVTVPAGTVSSDIVIQYKVSDGKSDSSAVNMTVGISPVNDAPTATPATDVSTSEDALVAILKAKWGFGDVDTGDVLTSEMVIYVCEIFEIE